MEANEEEAMRKMKEAEYKKLQAIAVIQVNISSFFERLERTTIRS